MAASLAHHATMKTPAFLILLRAACAIVTDPGATREAGRCVLNKGIAPVM